MNAESPAMHPQASRDRTKFRLPEDPVKELIRRDREYLKLRREVLEQRKLDTQQSRSKLKEANKEHESEIQQLFEANQQLRQANQQLRRENQEQDVQNQHQLNACQQQLENNCILAAERNALIKQLEAATIGKVTGGTNVTALELHKEKEHVGRPRIKLSELDDLRPRLEQLPEHQQALLRNMEEGLLTRETTALAREAAASETERETWRQIHVDTDALLQFARACTNSTEPPRPKLPPRLPLRSLQSTVRKHPGRLRHTGETENT